MREESAEYKKLKKKIRKRDNNTCQLCGYSKITQIHHVIRFADSILQRSDEQNLLLLCPFCHKSVTRREYYYAPLLKEIIMDKYK